MEENGEIRIITEPITRNEARTIGSKWYQELVKGVVDFGVLISIQIKMVMNL
jgi:hypothetical protein